MEDTKKEDMVVEPVAAKTPAKSAKKVVIIKNVSGKEMDAEDYFFNGKAPSTFNDVCGLPVEREDLVSVFNKVFNVKDNYLFYKTIDKEVYIIIVPLKNSTTVGAHNDSIDGDFQKHAISFISEGSVNPDTLKLKLKRILAFTKSVDN